MLLIVSYHYLGDENKWKNGGIYPVSQKRFEQQIIEIGKHFEFISSNELIESVYSDKNIPLKSCFITFDDGLSSQYELALPILEKHRVPACFFVCTKPFSEKKALDVHLLHRAIAYFTIEGLYEKFNCYFQEKHNIDIDNVLKPIPKNLKAHKYGNSKTNTLKYNFYNEMSLDLKQRLISYVFKEIGLKEKDLVNKIYIKKNQICDLYQKGFLGLHTHNHNVLSKMSHNEIVEDLKINKGIIENIVNKQINRIGVSYPFGRPAFLNKNVYSASKTVVKGYGLTTIRGINENTFDPFILKRMDTNDVPFGKNPTIDFSTFV